MNGSRRTTRRRLLTLTGLPFSLLTATIVALATEPTPPPASPAVEAPQAAPTGTATRRPVVESVAMPATAAHADPSAASNVVDEPEAARLSESDYRRVTQGYTRYRRPDGVMYCRTEKPLGSRLPQKYCLTLVQLIEMDRNRERARRQFERSQTLRPLREP